jgi:PIN domain nuclease of toxin-antitoxin system
MILLDTHALLWAAAEPERLGRHADLLATAGAEVLVSAASAWEIAIKASLGRLPLPHDASRWVPATIRRLAFTAIPVEHATALAAGELPMHHRDPFDRLLVAEARRRDVPILSADPAIREYDVEVLVP